MRKTDNVFSWMDHRCKFTYGHLNDISRMIAAILYSRYPFPYVLSLFSLSNSTGLERILFKGVTL
jgi:hypothetical protein